MSGLMNWLGEILSDVWSEKQLKVDADELYIGRGQVGGQARGFPFVQTPFVTLYWRALVELRPPNIGKLRG